MTGWLLWCCYSIMWFDKMSDSKIQFPKNIDVVDKVYTIFINLFSTYHLLSNLVHNTYNSVNFMLIQLASKWLSKNISYFYTSRASAFLQFYWLLFTSFSESIFKIEEERRMRLIGLVQIGIVSSKLASSDPWWCTTSYRDASAHAFTLI